MLIEKKVFKAVDKKIIKKIKNILEKWCEDKGYTTFEVIVVLYELYNNAATYSKNQVDVFIKFYSQSIVIRINDQGSGFNAKEKLKISKSDLNQKICKSSGRGIYIVKNFVSDICYNEKGNNVIVRIKENN